MLPDLPHLWSHVHFECPYILLQSTININVIFSLNFHQHCFVFLNHPLLSYKWAQTFTLSKVLVFSLTLCCVVFFTCVCVSLCNVFFKFILVSIWFYNVMMLLMLLWSFYCENLTRGDEKSCKHKFLLHHNCFYYSCNGPYNLAMLVTMLLKLLL
jgi:hypothetical protein